MAHEPAQAHFEILVEIGVRIRKQGSKDIRLVSWLWLSEGGPVLDPQGNKGANFEMLTKD